jgi:hypothetical protein
VSAPDYDDAEIEASRAPLLDHLVELRSRLIICVIAMGIAFAVCFAFSGQIYRFLLHPFSIAAQLLAAEQAAHAQAQGFDFVRFLTGTRDLFLALIGAREVPASDEAEKLRLIFTAPLEFFFTKLKLAGFGAVVLTFPVLAWQVYGFVAPGLYKRERKAFVPFLLASPTPVPDGRSAGLLRHPAVRAVVLAVPADRRRPGLGAAPAQGLGLYEPGHHPAAGLWPLLPAAGRADPARHGGHRILQRAGRRAPLRHCRGVRGGGGGDPA